MTAERWENVDKAVYIRGTQLAVITQLLGFAVKVYQPKVCVRQQLYLATPKNR